MATKRQKEVFEKRMQDVINAKTKDEFENALAHIRVNKVQDLFKDVSKEQMGSLIEHVKKYRCIKTLEKKVEIINLLEERGMSDEIYSFYEAVQVGLDEVNNSTINSCYNEQIEDILRLEMLFAEKCPDSLLLKLNVRLSMMGNEGLQRRIYQRLDDPKKIPRLVKVVEKITGFKCGDVALSEYLARDEKFNTEEYIDIYDKSEKIPTEAFEENYEKKKAVLMQRSGFSPYLEGDKSNAAFVEKVKTLSISQSEYDDFNRDELSAFKGLNSVVTFDEADKENDQPDIKFGEVNKKETELDK